MILKMNFNFNFKDMPWRPSQSIRRRTNRCDGNHTAQFRHWTAFESREGVDGGPRSVGECNRDLSL